MNRDPSGYFTLTEMESAMMINAIISRCAVSAVVGSIISSLEYVTHGGDFFSFGYVQASMNGFWTGALFGFVFGILGLVLNVFLFSIILVTLSFFTIQYGWERYKSGDHVWGFVYIGIGITVFCGTIFNLVRVLKPYISGGSKGNKPVGDQGKKSDGSQTDGYIPKDADGNPIPLKKQRINNQDIPVPDPAAEGRPHTVLGGKISSTTGEVYRQSATFPDSTWPLANGNFVPWSEVHWTDHGTPNNHSNPHQHIFEYNPDKGGWIRQEPSYFEN